MRLHELIENSARANPNAIAIYSGDHPMTYGELDFLSTRLASKLRELGVEPLDRVAIWAEKSPWIVVGMQAILKLGAAYVPLDPMCPAERAKEILLNCQVRAVLTTQSRMQEPLFGSLRDLPHLYFDGNGPLSVPTLSRQEISPFHGGDFSLETPAYILYTSGSTGTPKGICLSHQNAMAFIEWAAAVLKAKPSDRFSSHAPFHFDLSILDLYVPFLRGASVFLIPEGLAYCPKKLVEFIRQKQISHWYSVPSALILMMERGGLFEQPLDFLKAVLFAGEPFPIKHLRKLREFLPEAQLLNLYGPTETNVCTFYEVGEIPEDRDHPVPIGKACCGNRAWIAEEGELIIQGPTVMLGYWGKPPVKDRTYSTGDIVKLGKDGNFEFVGRRDHQVKIKGYRIDLGEVEATLIKLGNVMEAVVLVRGQGLHASLFACLRVDPGSALTLLDVKEFCAKFLPTYMLVNGLRCFSEFPRTSTGKIDRKALQLQVFQENP